MEAFDFTIRSVLKLMWTRKISWLILNFILVSSTLAYLLLWATPFYTSKVVIAPREMEGPSPSDLLSKLGGLGSMVGATLGVGGATNMDKTILLMQSGDFLSDFITKYDLLPHLFYNEWDSTSGQWIELDPAAQPNTLRGVHHLRDEVMSIVKDAAAGAITISMTIQGEGRSKQWVDWFLKETNIYLKRSIIEKSQRNQKFLKQRLSMTQNPLILEKVQSLLAYELEKEMLADDLSFDMIESAVVPNKPSQPNKVLTLILSVFLANFLWLIYILIRPTFHFLQYLIREPDAQ